MLSSISFAQNPLKQLVRWRSALPLCIVFALAEGCIRNPATRKLQTHLISKAAEKRIGEEAKKELLKTHKELSDEKLTSYVEGVGNRIVRLGDRPGLGYDFTILDTDLVNAFAIPGGYIFLTRGLLEQLEDESELAGVLGHEIAHVTAYHGVQLIQKEMGYGVITVLGAIAAASTIGPEALELIARSANLFTNLYLLGYARDKELEADSVGFRYAIAAGYDPQGFLNFFRRLQALEDPRDRNLRGWDLYFRTHPPTEERIRLVKKYISQVDPSSKPLAVNKEPYQREIARLPREDPGLRGEILGETFRNKTFKFNLRIPKGWTFEFFHPRYLVDFVSPDGRVRGELRRNEVPLFQSAQDYAARVAQDMGFKFVGGQPVLYPCGYAYLGRFLGSGITGEVMLVRMIVTVRGPQGFVLICFIPQEEAERYLLPVEQIMRSFGFDNLI